MMKNVKKTKKKNLKIEFLPKFYSSLSYELIFVKFWENASKNISLETLDLNFWNSQ